ncbi:hypothetical protein CCR94_17265 [Rhodoblastus sphagnicola]|uniref:CsbD family protein n=1 Tax=Rhodoblastus sphagnicola TaxID=333368 RepID=A0A2S6N1X0_9HYPH|nr:CsbD family protein [Rhodoblastus sphagnicola]MBB4198241.1 uncharacterized protein YjbJ (UPF0337 family) [Rhodoblastus sphagnicola]PPQ28596.1 hypothetical protein CCR94_17265 [Rhodoblastus sphagnicola]
MTTDTRIEGFGHKVRGAAMAQVGSLAGRREFLADGVKARNAGVKQNSAGGDRDLAREDLAP